ncbi:hypothetical protein [Gynuella sp.]|uniref:hypothetical protein n=1 Tax=Gynuella sp. TaxID=2969146 RepID=UPI003D0D51D2
MSVGPVVDRAAIIFICDRFFNLWLYLWAYGDKNQSAEVVGFFPNVLFCQGGQMINMFRQPCQLAGIVKQNASPIISALKYRPLLSLLFRNL